VIVGPPRPATLDASHALIRRGIAVRLIATVIISIAGLASTVLAVRLLGRSAYGSLAFGLALVGVVAVLAQFGLGTAVSRTIASQVAKDDQAAVRSTTRAAVTTMALAGAVASVVVIVAVAMLQTNIDPRSRFLLGAGLGALLLGTNAAAAATFIARGVGCLSVMETPNVALALGQLAWISLLSTLGRADVGVLAIGYGVVGIAGAVVAVGIIRAVVPSGQVFVPAPQEAGRLLASAGPYAIAGIASQVIAVADVLVLGATYPATEVATYEPTLRAIDRPMLLVPMLFLTGFMPAATAVAASGDRARFSDLYLSASRTAMVVAFPGVVLFAVFPTVASKVLFGARFPVSTTIVRLLLVGYVVNLLCGLNGGALVATGERRLLGASYLLALGAMAILAVGLIPPLGAIGAAVATSASYVVLNAAVAWSLWRAAGVPPFDARTLLVAATAVLACLGAAGLGRVVSGASTVEALVLCIAVWIVWVAALLWSGIVRRADVATLLPVRSVA
jgi:O-antigen/teichoic acid export membrane protein